MIIQNQCERYRINSLKKHTQYGKEKKLVLGAYPIDQFPLWAKLMVDIGGLRVDLEVGPQHFWRPGIDL